MRLRNFISVILVAAVAVSCHHSEEGSTLEIPLKPAEGIIRMSTLYEGYRTVVPDGMLISGIIDVAVADSILVVLGETDSGLVSIYGLEGDYRRSFLTRGRGPGEMTDIMAMACDMSAGTVDVLGNFGMDIYSFDIQTGRLKNSFSIGESEIRYAKDLLPAGDGRYLFYKDLSYIDGPEYEVYLYNPSTGEVEGRWLPLDKDFAEAASFSQANNLFEYGGRRFFYSAFSDGIYEFTGDTLVQYVRFADNGYSFTPEMKKRPWPQDLMEFVEACQKSGRIWGHVDLFMIGDRTMSVYNYGKDSRYAAVMDLEKGTSVSYSMLEDDMVWGIGSDSFFSPYYLRYTDGEYAVYLVEPFDIIEKIEDSPASDDPTIESNRQALAKLPYESNQIILMMKI